jgi:hypothetical protein
LIAVLCRPTIAPPNHLRLEANLVDRPHHTDRIGRIGADDNEIRIRRRDRPHGRRKNGTRHRISAVIDDGKTGRLGVLARAFGGVDGELRIGRDDGDCSRLGVLRHGGVEEALGEGRLGSRPGRNHREVVGIVELAVDREPEQSDQHFLLLDCDRHRRRQQVGAVAADDEIDLVDVEQLGIDTGHGRRIGLIIIMKEPYRTAEQPAFGIGILPDLLGEQGRPAVGGEPSRQRHAVADPDGARLRRRRGGDESTGGQRRDGEEGAGYRAGKSPNFHLDRHMRSNQSGRDAPRLR